MNLMNIVAIAVLMTNGAYCYIPRDTVADYSSVPKIIPMPIERQPFEINDRPVYDPGAGKWNICNLSFYVAHGFC